jgi:phosphoribosylamine-glycine ligase
MGAYSPAPMVTPEIEQQVCEARVGVVKVVAMVGQATRD